LVLVHFTENHFTEKKLTGKNFTEKQLTGRRLADKNIWPKHQKSIFGRGSFDQKDIWPKAFSKKMSFDPKAVDRFIFEKEHFTELTKFYRKIILPISHLAEFFFGRKLYS
jgi:hypothetical protein